MITLLNWTPRILMVYNKVWSMNGHQKTCDDESELLMCTKYANHSRLNNVHNWEGLYDHLKIKGCTVIATM